MDFTSQEFNGPLDLLLALIEDKKKDISEVSISEVTDQFLQYLTALPEDERAADEVADFLVVAARLLFMKSRALLPMFAPIEEEGPSLADQLRLYQHFVKVSRDLNRRWLEQLHSYFRSEPVEIIISEDLPANVSVQSLAESMNRLVQKLKPPKPLQQTKIDSRVSLREKIEHLRKLLNTQSSYNLLDSLSERGNRTEIIVSFLAILELAKQQIVHINQSEEFGDILVQQYNSGFPPARE